MQIWLKPPYQPEFQTTISAAKIKVAFGDLDPFVTMAWHEGLADWVRLSELMAMPPTVSTIKTSSEQPYTDEEIRYTSVYKSLDHNANVGCAATLLIGLPCLLFFGAMWLSSYFKYMNNEQFIYKYYLFGLLLFSITGVPFAFIFLRSLDYRIIKLKFKTKKAEFFEVDEKPVSSFGQVVSFVIEEILFLTFWLLAINYLFKLTGFANLFWSIALFSYIIYFLPTHIAFYRKLENRWAIFIFNLFLGATLIGWVVALAFAFMTIKSSNADRKV